MTSDEFLRALSAATGRDGREVLAAGAGAIVALLEEIESLSRPFIVLIDAVDEAAEPERVAEVISQLVRWPGEIPLRFLVATRRNLIPAFRFDDMMIIDFARQRLSAPDSPYANQSPELIDQIAQIIATRSFGSFLVARYVVEELVNGARVVDADSLQPPNVGAAIDAAIAQFGSDEPVVRQLLRALATGPEAGYSLTEWAKAASLPGIRSIDPTEVEQFLLRLNWLLTKIPDYPSSGELYRFFHYAIRDHFAAA